MKILIINQFAISESQAGSTRTFSLSKELVRSGHEVTIVAGGFEHFKQGQEDGPEVPQEEWMEGVRILRIPVARYRGNSLARVRNLVGFAWSIYRLDIQRLGLDPDIILASSPYPFAAYAAMKLAARHRKPFALEVRDLWPQTAIDLWNLREWNPLVLTLRYIESRLYRAADPLICLLPGAAEYLTNRGAVRERIVWIPNGVSMAQFSPWSEPTENRPLEILYAGTHGLANGLDAVLDAFKLLQQEGLEGVVELRLVGDGHQKARLQARCREEDIRMVVFEDPVPKTEIPRRMAQAQAFIVTLKDLPLYRYGISLNKIHEYLAAGRPIIFGCNAYNDPVAEAEAGFTVFPEDSGAIAGAIRSLLSTPPEIRMTMGLRGRKFAEQNHDFALLASRLELALAGALSRRT